MISNYETYSTPNRKNYQHNFKSFSQTADLRVKYHSNFNQQEKFKRQGAIDKILVLPHIVYKTPGPSNLKFTSNRAREAGYTHYAFARCITFFIFHIIYVITDHINKYGWRVNRLLLTTHMRDSLYKIYNEYNKYYEYKEKDNRSVSCNRGVTKRFYPSEIYTTLYVYSIGAINNYIHNVIKSYISLLNCIFTTSVVICN